jgi:SAM-dependent MidA family methyltransferase
MKASRAHPARPQFLEALGARARGRSAVTFAEFMEVALYDPLVGYYRRDRPRVGYGEGTDFITSESSPLFGRLVAAACTGLLAPTAVSDVAWVELGAEPGAGLFRGGPHPFRSVRQVRVGDPLRIEGPSVVFSNELFDAQPFRRFRFRQGRWRELGVSFLGGLLAETEIEGDAVPGVLPQGADDGYVIDAPLAAASLAAAVAGQPWSGLFLAFDYGKSWEEIVHGSPEGTARSYRRHEQGSDLLAHPGEQDLTCHVCWDWLRDALGAGGFRGPTVDSQEGFFVRHAAHAIEALASSDPGRPSRDKLSLQQLLHPGNLGRRFQALWALR